MPNIISTFVAPELTRCDRAPICCRFIDGRDATPEQYQAAFSIKLGLASVMAPGDTRAGRLETIIECRRAAADSPRPARD